MINTTIVHITGSCNLRKLHVDKGIKEMWIKDGKRHREDGPAIIYTNGTIIWYLNGEKHRIGGPAVEYGNGQKKWYQDGELHREDGPSIEYPGGHKSYYIKGRLYSKQAYYVRYPKSVSVRKQELLVKLEKITRELISLETDDVVNI